jgi:hypothetical protein
MIDWFNLLMNACWIFGCSLALASFSFASWEASQQRKSFKKILIQPNIQIFVNIGGFLFTIGLAGLTEINWQRILWSILAAGFLIQVTIETIAKRNRNS